MARSKTAPVPQTEEATVQEAITAGSAAQRSLAQLLAMPITTANLPMVGLILQDVVTKRKELDARLKSITAPMRAAEKSVRDLFKPALNALAEAEAFLKQGIGNAQREQYAANAAAMQQAQVALQHGDARAAALAAHAIAPISARRGSECATSCSSPSSMQPQSPASSARRTTRRSACTSHRSGSRPLRSTPCRSPA